MTDLVIAFATVLVYVMPPVTPAEKSFVNFLPRGTFTEKAQAVVFVSVMLQVMGPWQYGFERKMLSRPYLNLT